MVGGTRFILTRTRLRIIGLKSAHARQRVYRRGFATKLQSTYRAVSRAPVIGRREFRDVA